MKVLYRLFPKEQTVEQFFSYYRKEYITNNKITRSN